MSKRKKRKCKLNKKGKILITSLISLFVCLLAFIIIDPFNTRVKKEVDPPIVEEERMVIDNPDEEASERRMSIVMVGDALIHDAVYLDAKKSNGKYDFTSMFNYLGPIIQKYDLRYYNQESIIGGKNLGISGYPCFNAPPEQANALIKEGFNLVSLSNNHSFDKGEAGIKNSVKFWKSQTGVVTAGQYASQKERDAVPVFEMNGIKYAFLSYTMCTNGLSAPVGKEYYVNVYSKSLVKKDVAQAKANGADVIMVAMHWGVEYTHIPNTTQKETAKYLSSLGVNLIIGAHPHVIQPIEYVGNTLVIYSLGNLISSQRILGLEKVIGLLAGTDIVVDDNGKVKFENTNFELHYTYYTSGLKNYKVIPFSKLTNAKLNNYASINTKYRKIVDPKGRFNGNKK